MKTIATYRYDTQEILSQEQSIHQNITLHYNHLEQRRISTHKQTIQLKDAIIITLTCTPFEMVAQRTESINLTFPSSWDMDTKSIISYFSFHEVVWSNFQMIRVVVMLGALVFDQLDWLMEVILVCHHLRPSDIPHLHSLEQFEAFVCSIRVF